MNPTEKEKRRIYQREYYKKNKVKILEYSRRYYYRKKYNTEPPEKKRGKKEKKLNNFSIQTGEFILHFE